MPRGAAFVSLAAVMTCTEPVATAAGEWTGTMDRTFDTWTIDLSMAREADSLKGTADVRGTTGFHESYFLTGVQRGDSVVLRMMPVEDATINFAGTMRGGNQIVGRSWFKAETDNSRDVIFTRK